MAHPRYLVVVGTRHAVLDQAPEQRMERGDPDVCRERLLGHKSERKPVAVRKARVGARQRPHQRHPLGLAFIPAPANDV
jgi:hypothetical protein